jgi:hypothetical protein
VLDLAPTKGDKLA